MTKSITVCRFRVSGRSKHGRLCFVYNRNDNHITRPSFIIRTIPSYNVHPTSSTHTPTSSSDKLDLHSQIKRQSLVRHAQCFSFCKQFLASLFQIRFRGFIELWRSLPEERDTAVPRDGRFLNLAMRKEGQRMKVQDRKSGLSHLPPCSEVWIRDLRHLLSRIINQHLDDLLQLPFLLDLQHARLSTTYRTFRSFFVSEGISVEGVMTVVLHRIGYGEGCKAKCQWQFPPNRWESRTKER